MKALDQRTHSFTSTEVDHNWFVVDADGQTLGRLATRVATILRGKHKPQFTPHNDTGDFVIVLNAGKVKVTGNRAEQKTYYHNTLYPGGARFEKFKDLRVRKPEDIIGRAVRGMLPKNTLGEMMFKKLKVYAGAEHPHAAQKPEPLVF
jgi:large subunit ribosomal protein L13